MTKYVKVMFGTTSGANKEFEYKINEVNVANNWNPTATSGKEFGGFNFTTDDKILRWLHRGDTIYDVKVPEDAEIVEIDGATTIYRANKIIINNPRKINDDIALEFYKKSNIAEISYYKALGAVSLMNYKNTALAIFKEKVNKSNIDIVLDEWNNFIDRPDRKDCNETVKMIEKLLLEFKTTGSR